MYRKRRFGCLFVSFCAATDLERRVDLKGDRCKKHSGRFTRECEPGAPSPRVLWYVPFLHITALFIVFSCTKMRLGRGEGMVNMRMRGNPCVSLAFSFSSSFRSSELMGRDFGGDIGPRLSRLYLPLERPCARSLSFPSYPFFYISFVLMVHFSDHPMG